MINEQLVITHIREKRGRNNNLRYIKDNKIPGIIYSKDYNKKIYIDFKEYEKIIKLINSGINIFKCSYENIEYDIIIKEIKYHPVKLHPIHIDLQKINDNEMIENKIPIKFNDEKKSPGIIAGGCIIKHLIHITVKSKKENMPNCINVDLSTINIGQSIRIKDINFQKNIIIPILNKKENYNMLVATIAGSRILTENKIKQ